MDIRLCAHGRIVRKIQRRPLPARIFRRSREPRPVLTVHIGMQDELPVLYVKTGCPWCAEVISFLSDNGIGFREKNVSQDESAAEEMKRISHQTKAPVLDWHGQILADFGVAELKPFLLNHSVRLEDS